MPLSRLLNHIFATRQKKTVSLQNGAVLVWSPEYTEGCPVRGILTAKREGPAPYDWKRECTVFASAIRRAGFHAITTFTVPEAGWVHHSWRVSQKGLDAGQLSLFDLPHPTEATPEGRPEDQNLESSPERV